MTNKVEAIAKAMCRGAWPHLDPDGSKYCKDHPLYGHDSPRLWETMEEDARKFLAALDLVNKFEEDA